jgi:hypothetical protein
LINDLFIKMADQAYAVDIYESHPELRPDYEAQMRRSACEGLSILISNGGSPELIACYKAQKAWLEGFDHLCEENLRSAKNTYYRAYFAYCASLHKKMGLPVIEYVSE